jgi:hypothetical protein
MKTTFLILIIATTYWLFSSCKKKGTNTVQTTTQSSNVSPSNPTPVANVIVTAGGQNFTLNGACGWAVAGGVHYIGAQDATVGTRALEIDFNVDELPTQTTTYTIVQNDYTNTNPTEVSISIAEITGNTLTSWKSSATSGTLTVVVTGNKISIDLSAIVLDPEQPSSFYTNGNVGAFSQSGIMSGTLTFYK